MPTLAEDILAGILAQEPPDDRPRNDTLLRKLKEREAAKLQPPPEPVER